MKTILLTAFSPFGDYLDNSSSLVIAQLKSTSEYNIVPAVFDCKIPAKPKDRGEAVLDTAQKVKASAIISLGMASEKTGLCIEASAKNCIFCPKYHPSTSAEAIDQSLDKENKLDLDLSPWQLETFSKRCDDAKIPLMDLSQEAGGFCCNHLMWQTRSRQLKDLRQTNIPFIFLHIPCSEECVKDPEEFNRAGKITMPIEQVTQGLWILLEVADLSS